MAYCVNNIDLALFINTSNLENSVVAHLLLLKNEEPMLVSSES